MTHSTPERKDRGTETSCRKTPSKKTVFMTARCAAIARAAQARKGEIRSRNRLSMKPRVSSTPSSVDPLFLGPVKLPRSIRAGIARRTGTIRSVPQLLASWSAVV